MEVFSCFLEEVNGLGILVAVCATNRLVVERHFERINIMVMFKCVMSVLHLEVCRRILLHLQRAPVSQFCPVRKSALVSEVEHLLNV